MAEKIRLYKVHLARIFITFMLCRKWRKRYKLFGGSIQAINRNRLRYAFTFEGFVTHIKCYSTSLNTLHWFLVTSTKFVLKLRQLFKILTFIQKRFLARFYTREAKIEVLNNAWNKLCGQLNEQNIEVKSIFMSEMLVKIQSLNPVIKRRALEEYLRCSQRVHTIAFLQWRLKYPKLKCNVGMLISLIEERMNFMYGNLNNGEELPNMPDGKYKCVDQFYEFFGTAIERAKSFNIWSFEQIGLNDPYPDELMETTFFIPKTEEDLVYRGDRYVKGNSPNAIYFPSKKMLFKIMRACIDVEDENKLWFKK